MKDLLSYYLIVNIPPESSQAKVSRMISTNPHLPSSEMTGKLRRSRTEEGLRKELLISREEKSRLLSSTRDESRDSAFFSLNNTSHCLSLELSQPAEGNEQKIESSIYEEQQVENNLPKPLFLEVPCPTQSLFTCSIAQLLNYSIAQLLNCSTAQLLKCSIAHDLFSGAQLIFERACSTQLGVETTQRIVGK